MPKARREKRVAASSIRLPEPACRRPFLSIYYNARVLTPAGPYLQLEDERNDGIIIEGGDLSKSSSAVAFKNGASDKSVKWRNVTWSSPFVHQPAIAPGAHGQQS